MVADGVSLYLGWVLKRIGMQDLAEEVKVVEKYFFQTQRYKGETLTNYANEEEHSYRKLKMMLNRLLEKNVTADPEYSSDGESYNTGKDALREKRNGH